MVQMNFTVDLACTISIGRMMERLAVYSQHSASVSRYQTGLLTTCSATTGLYIVDTFWAMCLARSVMAFLIPDKRKPSI